MTEVSVPGVTGSSIFVTSSMTVEDVSIVMATCEPAIVESAVSLTVIDWSPVAYSVTPPLKVWVPLSPD